MKKNIAIIITKLNGGGAERCASNLSIELNKHYNVYLIVFNGNDITYPHGGRLIDLHLPESDTTLKRACNVFRRASVVRKIKKKYKIECTISLLDGPNLVNILSKTGDKTIVSIRNCRSQEPMGSGRKKLISFISRKADLTVALSKYVENDMIEKFSSPKEKTITIYNHCDAELLNRMAGQGKRIPVDIGSSEEFLYVTMGRLNKQKGQWHLLRAFSEVLKAVPDSRLLLLGDGELEKPLKKLARALRIEKKVDFLGFMKNPHGLLKQCDVFVFPSQYEGLGNVLLEALAMGLPVIATDCAAGPREILAPDTDLIPETCKELSREEYGILVPVCDRGHFNAKDPLTKEENELVKAMVKLYENKTLREQYREKAEQRISTFSKEKVIADWVRAIEA